MNSNTILGLQTGTKRNNLLAITGIGTGATIFTMGADTGTGVNAYHLIPTQGTIQGNFSPLGPNINAALTDAGFTPANNPVYSNPPFNSSSFDGRPFKIRVSGDCVTSAGSNSATVAILQNTSAVLAGGNTLASQASGTLAAANFNFLLEVTCIWDSVSSKLVTMQTGNGHVAGTIVAPAVATSTSVTLPGAFIVASITFGAGAANTVTPVEFSIEML